LCYHDKLQNLTVYENYFSGELPKSVGNWSYWFYNSSFAAFEAIRASDTLELLKQLSLK
jgi:hypothetical protein